MPATFDSRDYQRYSNELPDAKRILAEGDSWFAYPRKYLLFGGDANIIDHLADKQDLVIYNTSSNGDEAVAMLSGDQKLDMIKRLKHNYFDHLLFSGGGNDIVGRYDVGFLIRQKKPGMQWQDCLDEDRIALKLGQIESSYRILCEITQEFSKNKNITIISHCYDLPFPRQDGFRLFDVIPTGKGWMAQYMVQHDITDIHDQTNIIHTLLRRLRDSLNKVANDYPGLLKVVDTHGSLERPAQWADEIHPNSDGFGLIADKIYAAIQE